MIIFFPPINKIFKKYIKGSSSGKLPDKNMLLFCKTADLGAR